MRYALLLLIACNAPSTLLREPAHPQVQGPRLLAQLGHAQRVHTMLVSPDGKRVATRGGDSEVKVWDGATGLLVGQIAINEDPTGRDEALAWSANARRLAFRENESLRVVDVDSGYDVARLVPPLGSYESLFALDTEGIRLFALTPDHSAFELWDLVKGKRTKTIAVDDSPALFTSPDGTRAAIRVSSKRVLVVSLDTGAVLSESGAKEMVLGGIDDAGELVLSWEDGGLPSKPTFSRTHKAEIELSTQSLLVTELAAKKQTRLWAGQMSMDTYFALSLARVFASTEGDVRSLTLAGFSSEVRAPSMRHGVVERVRFDGAALIVQHDESTDTWRFEPKTTLTRKKSDPVSSLDYQQGLLTARVSDTRVTLKRDDMTVGSIMTNDLQSAVAFSRDAARIAMTGVRSRTTAAVYDTATSREVMRVQVPQAIGGMALSSDGRMLAVGLAREVRLFDAKTGQLQRQLSRPSPSEAGYRRLVFSPDDQTLAASIASDIVLFALGEPRAPRSLSLQTSVAYDFAFSADGRRLACVGHDTTVRMWDLKNDKVSWMLLALDAARWVAVDPTGRFEGTEAGKALLHSVP